MGSGKPKWKLTFHHRSSAPSSPSSAAAPFPPPPPPSPPPEFTCPISGSLMADPVILPSGHTFERNCIQACQDLSFSPIPDVPIASSPLVLIPNVALRSAITRFCDRSSLPIPLPTSPDAARRLLRRLMPPVAAADGSSSETVTPPTPPPAHIKAPSCFSSSSTTSSSYHSSSSISSSDLIAAAAAATTSPTDETLTLTLKPPISSNSCSDPLEAEILARLKIPDAAEQEAALGSLRCATRESRDRRIALCTPRLLAALRPFLLSRHAALQSHAAAAVVNLSLEAPNKVRVVRAGAVPPLVDALKCGHAEARDHAAGAIFSLALEEENKTAIGVLGAIRPLLQLFSMASNVSSRARRDAGLALYHLSLAGSNRSKLARTPGAVRALLKVAGEKAEEEAGAAPSLGRLALMVVCNLAGCSEGRAVLMDSGAVVGLVGVMRAGMAAAAEEEYCVTALYGLSRGSLRFRGLARAEGAEEVLAAVAEGGSGEVGREMARRTLMAMRGEEEEEEFVAEDGGSVVSDGLVSFRRRYKDFGTVSGSNSAEF